VAAGAIEEEELDVGRVEGAEAALGCFLFVVGQDDDPQAWVERGEEGALAGEEEGFFRSLGLVLRGAAEQRSSDARDDRPPAGSLDFFDEGGDGERGGGVTIGGGLADGGQRVGAVGDAVAVGVRRGGIGEQAGLGEVGQAVAIAVPGQCLQRGCRERDRARCAWERGRRVGR